MLKNRFKDFLEQHSPELLYLFSSTKNRRNFRRTFLSRQAQVKTKIYKQSNPYVLSGPFAGMRYLDEIVWGPIESKWLGTYEQELHPVIEQILKTSYTVIIDVGSAEGYYSVGLATKLRNAQVYSYDIDPWARIQQRKLAQLNEATNIRIGKFCKSEDLTSHISGRTLLVCDIEGHEYDLLDPNKTPTLRQCDILVEVHPFKAHGFTTAGGADELIHRFSASHKITKIGVEPHSTSAIEIVLREKLTSQELADCMDERRSPEQLWLWLEAHKSH